MSETRKQTDWIGCSEKEWEDYQEWYMQDTRATCRYILLSLFVIGSIVPLCSGQYVDWWRHLALGLIVSGLGGGVLCLGLWMNSTDTLRSIQESRDRMDREFPNMRN